jgi:hypothetical protein
MSNSNKMKTSEIREQGYKQAQQECLDVEHDMIDEVKDFVKDVRILQQEFNEGVEKAIEDFKRRSIMFRDIEEREDE